MATNQARWIRNLFGAPKPLVMLGLFQAGVTAAVNRGELLELTADGNTKWIPMNSDFAGSANVAIANEEIKSGDRAGYYEIIVPRPGDLFEFDLDTANNPALATALYYSSSEVVSESGSNILAYVAGQDHYPDKQGHLSDDASGDAGATLRNTAAVHLTFKEAVSYWKALNVA